MSLFVLGIACSPRRNGNTTHLLLEAMKIARDEGHTTETVYLSDLKITPCQGCNACSIDGTCVIKDDVPMLQEKMIRSVRLIIAAPIFFMGVNAQTKILIDRMQTFWALKYLHQKSFLMPSGLKRSGLFISTAGTRKPDVFLCAERSIKTFFHMLDTQYTKPCLFSGVDKVGEIEEYPTYLDELRKTTHEFLKS